jgi:hypothetical protein
MSSNVINFVSLRHLTVLSVMTKIKHAKIVDKLVTGNTTAPSNATLQLTSFVAFAVMQVIWLETVPTGTDHLDMIQVKTC